MDYLTCTSTVPIGSLFSLTVKLSEPDSYSSMGCGRKGADSKIDRR